MSTSKWKTLQGNQHHAQVWCTDRRPAILAIHGFSGAGADFAPFAAQLGRDLIAPDLIGHGLSDAPDDSAPYAPNQMLDALESWLPEDAVMLGYSMGGRLALRLTLARPDRVRALILVGSTAGIQEPDTRRERQRADLSLAEQIETDGVQWFAEHWASVPIIATQERIPSPYREEMQQRKRSNRAHGLAHTLRSIGQGTFTPCWEQLHTISCPVLLLTGTEDLAYGDIAEQMRQRIAHAEHTVLDDAGHCAHLEQPAPAAAAVEAFLRRVGVE